MEEKKRNAKGEGTFIQNKNGTITHKLNVGRRWDGHPKVLTVTCETRAACIREMRKKVAEWNASHDNAEATAKQEPVWRKLPLISETWSLRHGGII